MDQEQTIFTNKIMIEYLFKLVYFEMGNIKFHYLNEILVLTPKLWTEITLVWYENFKIVCH